MQSHVLIVTGILLATVTDGAHGHLLHRRLTRDQLPVPCQHAAAGSPYEAFPTSAVDTAWSKAADDTSNSVMYFVETKHELFVFGKGVPAPIKAPETTVAPSEPTRVPATSTSAPTKSTSALTTSTGTPTTRPLIPRERTEDVGAPSASTRAPATSTNAPTMSTSALTTSTGTPTTRPLIPRGYTYSPVTGSYYKLHFEGYLSWDDANTACADEGASLLVVNDAEEADIVASIMRIDVANNHYYYPWTGLRDNRPGGLMDWRTIHGEPLSDVFHDWDVGRPHNDTQWTCAGFRTDIKQLRSYPCDERGSFACEISQ